MKLKIEIVMDNAAFDEDALGEAAIILHRAAALLAAGNSQILLQDSNGNRVGTLIVDGRKA